MDNDKALPIEKAAQRLVAYREKLVEWLQEALEDTLFSNRTFIRPSHLNQIAVAEADAFLAFLKSEDTTAVRVQGAKRAEEGVGEQAVLRVAATLRRFCHTHLEGELFQAGLAATDIYTNTFLEGFIETSETIILAEQERIRAALERALSRYTLQLQTAAEVSRAATSILNLDELLTTSVEIIRERFNLYYAGLFLVDEYGEWAVLRAGTGKAGLEMVRRGHKLKVGGESTIGWCIARRQARIVLDVGKEAVRSDKPLLPETRSEVALPLISRGRVVGAMTLQRSGVAAFGDEDITTLQTMADQLANAIENAQLYAAAQREITERKRAEEALRRYRDQLVELVEERTAKLTKANEQLQREIAERRQAEEALRESEERYRHIFEQSPIGIGIASLDGKVVNVNKAMEAITGYSVEDFNKINLANTYENMEDRETLFEAISRYRSQVNFPVRLKRKDGTPYDALLNVSRISLGGKDFLHTICQDITERKRAEEALRKAHNELERRVKELSALYAIAEMVNHSDLNAVLQLALDSAITLTGMDSGGILLLDSSTDELFLRAHRGWSPELIRAVSRTRAGEGLMPRMLKSALVVDDLSKVTEDRRVAIEKEGLQSLVSIPLQAKESPLGVVVIASRSPRTFASQELELLAAIGNQVGVAVDKANLQAQKLRAAILGERQDMARQMHDDIAQTLGYLGLQVDSVMGSSSLAHNVEVQAELEEIRTAIEDAYERVHSSIMRLREDVPGHFDLGAALPEIISEFEKQTGCRLESRIDKDQLLRLPPPAVLQVTYIVREALTNVRKHSDADSVHLTLQGLEDGRVEVTIQDNGRGFDPDSEQQSGGGGFGLRFMKERAERVGGSLRIESGPGQGTRVVVSLPSG